MEDIEEPTEIGIVGAGIVGLVLALSLHKHLGIKPELYEQAQAFHDDVGAGQSTHIKRKSHLSLVLLIQKRTFDIFYRYGNVSQRTEGDSGY